MTGRKELLTATYKPELSIVVYKSERDYYLESHSVNEKGELLEGKPLLQDTIQAMVDTFFDQNQNKSKITGMIPEGLLAYDPLPGGYFKMIWYRPAEVRFIHFASQLRLKSGRVWVPPMIYRVHRKDFDVYALKVNKRPGEAAKLFRAPFHNVSDTGNVCLGNAEVSKPKEKTFENMLKYWEDLFWLSEFSHLNGASNPTKTNLGKLWTRFVKSKEKLKWSEVDELLELKGLTLKKILK